MLASTDPITFLVLILVAIVLLVTLRGRSRRHAVESRLLAEATGHPSAGLPAAMSWAERVRVASDAADRLAAAGMVCAQMSGMPTVRARGLDGDYLVAVHGAAVTVHYEHNGGREQLGRFPATHAAVEVIVEHAGVAPTP